MTKGDKRNKREYERKLKSQGGAGLNHKTEGEARAKQIIVLFIKIGHEVQIHYQIENFMDK